MDIDLSTPVAAWLGLTPAQLGTYLLYLVLAAPVISWLRPQEPALVRWREGAALTATTADDAAVAMLTRLWSLLLLVPVVVLRVVPVFTKAVEAAREQRRGPPKSGAVLGLVLTAVLLAGAAVTTGCATGHAQAQALHHGLTDATDLVDPMYAQAVVECDLQEREVIASHAPDQGDAAAVALAAVRVRCDVALASFEAVRGLQLALRATADAMADGRATVTDVVRSLDELAAAVETSRALVSAIRSARGAP